MTIADAELTDPRRGIHKSWGTPAMKAKTLCRSAARMLIGAVFGSLLLYGVALAQTVEERLTKAEADLKVAQTAGDNAWMLASSALVLLMTGPGLALFY